MSPQVCDAQRRTGVDNHIKSLSRQRRLKTYLIRRVGWQVPKRQRFGEAFLPPLILKKDKQLQLSQGNSFLFPIIKGDKI